MSSFEIGLLVVVSYICVFSIVNRICTCIENCAMAKAHGKAVNSKITVEEFADGINNENQ